MAQHLISTALLVAVVLVVSKSTPVAANVYPLPCTKVLSAGHYATNPDCGSGQVKVNGTLYFQTGRDVTGLPLPPLGEEYTATDMPGMVYYNHYAAGHQCGHNLHALIFGVDGALKETVSFYDSTSSHNVKLKVIDVMEVDDIVIMTVPNHGGNNRLEEEFTAMEKMGATQFRKFVPDSDSPDFAAEAGCESDVHVDDQRYSYVFVAQKIDTEGNGVVYFEQGGCNSQWIEADVGCGCTTPKIEYSGCGNLAISDVNSVTINGNEVQTSSRRERKESERIESLEAEIQALAKKLEAFESNM